MIEFKPALLSKC